MPQLTPFSLNFTHTYDYFIWDARHHMEEGKKSPSRPQLPAPTPATRRWESLSPETSSTQATLPVIHVEEAKIGLTTHSYHEPGPVWIYSQSRAVTP